MKKLLLILSLTFISSLTGSAQISYAQQADAMSEVSKTFEVRSNLDQTVQWIESNQKSLRDVLNITVIEDLGKGKLKVKRETPKGDFIWIIQETTNKTKNKYTYKSILTKSISGGIVYSDTVITIVPTRKGCEITITMSAGVNNPVVRDGAMKIDFVNHINKWKRMIEQNL